MDIQPGLVRHWLEDRRRGRFLTVARQHLIDEIDSHLKYTKIKHSKSCVKKKTAALVAQVVSLKLVGREDPVSSC